MLSAEEGPGHEKPGETVRGKNRKPLRGGEVSRRSLLGVSRIVPDSRAGMATLLASAGWRARRRARTLGAALDNLEAFVSEAWVDVTAKGMAGDGELSRIRFQFSLGHQFRPPALPRHPGWVHALSEKLEPLRNIGDFRSGHP